MRPGPAARLMREAARRHSVFTRAHALQIGMSKSAIQWNLDQGRWVALHSGVYVPTGLAIGWEQRVMAACLACGPTAVASYDSAALIWGSATGVDVPHVSVLGTKVRDRPGIVVHRADDLEAVTHKRFRVTRPMRTLLDLASRMPKVQLARILDDAQRRRLIYLNRLAAYLDEPRNRARPGSGELRQMVRARDPRAPIRSDLETIFFEALRAARLPLPVPQHPVLTASGRKVIDFAYTDRHLAIELDGWETHGTPQAFEDDRARQNELEDLGWHFRRFTWKQLERDSVGVAFTVGKALGLVPVRWCRVF